MNNFREIATSLPAQAYNSLISIVAKSELMGSEELKAFMEAVTLTALEEKDCEITLKLLSAVHEYANTICMIRESEGS